ncbi:hypothetical protein D3C85_1454580 [compost metagenome]
MEQKEHTVAEVLINVRNAVRMAHSALMQIEVVHGIRPLEPSNGLDQEIRELTWAIATLNGMTQLPPPVAEMRREVKRARDAQRCPDNGLDHRQAP